MRNYKFMRPRCVFGHFKHQYIYLSLYVPVADPGTGISVVSKTGLFEANSKAFEVSRVLMTKCNIDIFIFTYVVV